MNNCGRVPVSALTCREEMEAIQQFNFIFNDSLPMSWSFTSGVPHMHFGENGLVYVFYMEVTLKSRGLCLNKVRWGKDVSILLLWWNIALTNRAMFTGFTCYQLKQKMQLRTWILSKLSLLWLLAARVGLYLIVKQIPATSAILRSCPSIGAENSTQDSNKSKGLNYGTESLRGKSPRTALAARLGERFRKGLSRKFRMHNLSL